MWRRLDDEHGEELLQIVSVETVEAVSLDETEERASFLFFSWIDDVGSSMFMMMANGPVKLVEVEDEDVGIAMMRRRRWGMVLALTFEDNKHLVEQKPSRTSTES